MASSSSSPLSLFSFLLFLSLASPSISTNTEGEALHALRTRLHDPTNVLQSWDPTLVNPCTWFHVTCDDKNHVIRLDLGNSNISGPLGPELGNLEHLQYLELYSNNFEGKIPKELGNLKSLISMDLYGNKLQGEIPKSFAKLKSLRFLRLNNNKLTGSIPRELASLSNLKVFDVSSNDLCGTIPIDGPFSNFPLQRSDSSLGLMRDVDERGLLKDKGDELLSSESSWAFDHVYNFGFREGCNGGRDGGRERESGLVMVTTIDSMDRNCKDLCPMTSDVERRSRTRARVMYTYVEAPTLG
ncbi:uncharacterized protein A4U43_C08F12860 [Asparagus officinalis]|nr:uncharacterized protein A4U43_C08F12860 [Asparagus officinalis]